MMPSATTQRSRAEARRAASTFAPARAGARARSSRKARSAAEPSEPGSCRKGQEPPAAIGDGRRDRPREETRLHTRLIKCTLAVEESRAYWRRVRPSGRPPTPERAFEGYWFGAKSLPWVKVLLLNFRARFDSYPEALAVLHAWRDMSPEVRALVCHWHLALADPFYRGFTGEFLPERASRADGGFRRSAVLAWLERSGLPGWTIATRKQLATKLLTAAAGAGLVGKRRDPRTVTFPTVPDQALEYLLHLLRGVKFDGTMHDNAYLRSVGLCGAVLENRLRSLSSLEFRRAGDAIEYGWRHDGLLDWALGRGIRTAGSVDRPSRS